jgi:1-acyl-sn-glycerol-3-phosphate acyltransferase
MDTLNRCWRIAVVAAGFAWIGIGGIVCSLTVFPLLRLASASPALAARRARVVIRHSFGALVALLRWGGVMRVEARNLEALRHVGPALVLANHPSYLDIVVLIAHIPDAVCVVKSAVWWNPFFGGVVRAAHYVRNDEPDRLIEQCAASLAEGKPLVIFPEGTRTAPGEPLHFVRGAAHIALKSGAAIQPVVLRCDPPAFTRTGHWYEQPPHGFRLTIEAMPRIGAGALLEAEQATGFKPRALTRALERFFASHLETPRLSGSSNP